MRVVLVLLLRLAFFAFASAEAFQYSSGWTPGQTTPLAPPTIPTGSVGVWPGGRFSWLSILTSGPIGNLFTRSGINITEKLAEAQRKAGELPWDDRIHMIRDDNFEELILNETFATPEEENMRLWFLVVTVTSNQRTGISAIVDQEFNEAYNISLSEQDLPHVRWGRIDYFNVTRLTTKWAVWRAPMFIVAKNRGKNLRFFHPHQLGVKAPLLRDFLVQQIWSRKQPWTGSWAPGGSREELLDKFAIFQEKLYFYMTKIPRWMYLVLSGGLGSLILNLFHRKPNPNPTTTTAQSVQTQSQSSSIGKNKEGTQKRRGNRK